MRSVPALLFVVFLAACSTPQPASTSLADGSMAHTLSCEAGWADCYRSAQQICGSRGFVELDRAEDGMVSSAGRLERMHSIEGGIDNHVYSETPREEIFQRVLTIRCRTPGK